MCCSCCVSLLNFFNRVINFVLCVAGLSIFGWGLYLFSLAEWQPQATIIVIVSTGFLLALTTGVFIVVGHKKPTYLRVYKVLIILLILFNVVLGFACLVPELRDDIINEVTEKAGKDIQQKLKENIEENISKFIRMKTLNRRNVQDQETTRTVNMVPILT